MSKTRIVATFHQSSAVLGSVKCQLSSRDLEHLVVAKLNSLEVYSLQEDGLQLECTLEIWGRVLAVRAIPIMGSVRSNLLVMLDHPDPELIFLSYTESAEAGSAKLSVRKQLALYERGARPAEFYNNVLVDPFGQLAVVSCYTGRLNLIQLKSGGYDDNFDSTIPEMNLLGLAFLPQPEGEWGLALLHVDNQGRCQLVARDVEADTGLQLSHTPSTKLHPTLISTKMLPYPCDLIPTLIPVPPTAESSDENVDGSEFLGGMLIIGGKKIMLYELTSQDEQDKQRGKRRRLEDRKSKPDEAEKAKKKEEERSDRKKKARATVEWPWSEVRVCSPIDQDSLRFLIGDAFGRICMLSLASLNQHGLVIIPLGETSPPTTLTYLTNQVVYVGSFMGDPQTVKIISAPTSSREKLTLPIPSEIRTMEPSRFFSSPKGKGRASDDDASDDKGWVIKTKGSYLEVIDTYKNIAPIHDAALVDTDVGGQRQIVTCSGGQNTGSLNVIRTGADFEELASIPGLVDVTSIWPLRMHYDDSKHTHIVISTLQSTQVFRIDSASKISRIEPSTRSFVTDAPTLCAHNIARRVVTNNKGSYQNSSLVVQVTSRTVTLLDYNAGLGEYSHLADWQMGGAGPAEIVAASINGSQVLVAATGGRLTALTIENDKFREIIHAPPLSFGGKIAQQMPNTRLFTTEISAVSCAPLDPARHFTNFFAVAFWHTNHIKIYSPDQTKYKLICESPALAAPVRSLLFFNLGADSSPQGRDHHPYLLAGLADGSVVSFQWAERLLKDKTVISLGTAPVTLTACKVDSKPTVFAAGSRSGLLSWNKGRVGFSPIMLKEVRASSSLHTESFSSSLILGTPLGVFITRVRDLDKMYIRTIPLGLVNPRRIVHEPVARIFGVASTVMKPSRIGDVEPPESVFTIFDDVSFDKLSQYECQPLEEVVSITTHRLVVDKTDIVVICLGTYISKPDETEPSEGNLLVFRADRSSSSDSQPSLVASAPINGCAYSVVTVNGLIAAAVNSSVMLFRLTASDSPSDKLFTLQNVSEWNHNYVVTQLAVFKDRLVVCDQISSVSLLQVHSDYRLITLARDFGPLWPMCVEAFDEKNIIGANDAMNLFSFTSDSYSGRTSLIRNGFYHLGDVVTKLLRGSLVTSDTASDYALNPTHIFFTTSGRIGAVINVGDDQLAKHLTELQRNMGQMTDGVGGVSHARYRAPKNTRGRSDADEPSFGFLDGDFLEQLVAIMASSPGQVDNIFEGKTASERLTASPGEIHKVLETLQNLH